MSTPIAPLSILSHFHLTYPSLSHLILAYYIQIYILTNCHCMSIIHYYIITLLLLTYLVIKHMHQQQQRLENAITALNSKMSPLKSFRCLSLIVKALDQYNTDQEMLPSERFIPTCLFVVPNKICQLIQHDPSTLLLQKPSKMGYSILVHLYLKSLLRLLTESTDQIKHIIVQGMSRSITLIGPFPQLAKKWIKILLELWGTSKQNLQISLRCHVALSRFLQKCDPAMYMWALRRMYVSYFENCKQVSWRNFEHINFMINSFCEIVKFETERAYYVLFGYLRSISLQLDKSHKSKRKEKVEMISKLFSNQILNCFKLFTAVVTRVESEEFTALIYPLCEMFAAYERVTESPQYIPLKLHLLEYQLTIIQSTSVYIPHTFELIEKLLKYPTFNKKIAKKSEKSEANIELAYKISKSQLSQALLINELFRSLMTKVYWFQSLMCRTVYGSQVIAKLHKILKSHKYAFSQYQQQLQKTATLFKQDSETLYKMRAADKMSLTTNKKIKKFEDKLKQMAFSGSERYFQLKADEEQLLKDKLAAEQQQNKQQEQNEESVKEDEDEVNSGWQQASEGASQLDAKEIEESEQDDEGAQQISYEGDPQDADEAAKEWSQEEWSSQNDINEM